MLEINAKGKFDFSVAQDAISGDILGGYAPKLRTVTIGGPFSHRRLWTAPVLRNISRLTLAVSSENNPELVSSWPERLPLPDVLYALEKMEQLQELTLVMGPYPVHIPNLSYFVPGSIPSAGVVTLHQLSAISLVGHLRDVTAVARHVCLPRAASVYYDISLRPDDIANDLNTNVFLKLPELMLPTKNLPLAKIVQIYCAQDYASHDISFCVRSWSNSRTTTNEELNKEKPVFSVMVSFPSRGGKRLDRKTATTALLTLLDNISLNCVRELHWTAPQDFFFLDWFPLKPSDCYERVLERFTRSLDTLAIDDKTSVRYCAPRCILNALENNPHLLPGLRTYRLVGWRITKTVQYTASTTRSPDVENHF